MSQVPGHFYPNFNMDTIGLISFSFISISVISEYCNSSSRHSDVENPYFILNSYKIVQQRYIQNGCIESLYTDCFSYNGNSASRWKWFLNAHKRTIQLCQNKEGK